MRIKFTPLRLGIVIAGAISLWMISGIFDKGNVQEDDSNTLSGQDVRPYKALRIEPQLHSEAIAATGEIRAKYDVDIYPEVSGKVTKISVDSGARLKKGQEILQISRGSALEAYERARANLSAAKTSYEGAESLMDSEIFSKHQFEKAKVDLEAAKADFVSAKANLDKYKIVAPGDCKIYNVNLDIGDTVTQTTKLGSCVNDDIMLVKVYLSERQIGRMNGDLHKAIVQDVKGNNYLAKLSSISRVAEDGVHSFCVELEVGNNTAQLISGQTMDVVLSFKPRSMYKIPHSALSINEKGETVVKIVNKNDDVHVSRSARITIVEEDNEGMWVQLEGKEDASEDINVFVRGHKYLKDGQVLPDFQA